MPSEVLEATPPNGAGAGRLVTRIVDDGLPFGGTWTWEIRPAAGGSEVTITEDGVIKNAFFRGMSALVFGYVESQKTYLFALGKKMGEDGEPVVDGVTFP